MAISYPLSTPTNIGIAQIELRAVNAVAYSRSPFTFSGQAFAYSGQMWQADVSLPNMKRQDAEYWVTFLLSLRGQYGTFLLGDPLGATPRGVATGTPIVNGAGQTGGELDITGATTSTTGWLLAGDYIQLGSAGTSTLHKVLADANSDGSGNVTVDIWPHLRTAPTNSSNVILNDTKGVFRLASNEQAWSINEISSYGITFGAQESL